MRFISGYSTTVDIGTNTCCGPEMEMMRDAFHLRPQYHSRYWYQYLLWPEMEMMHDAFHLRPQ